MQKHIGLAGPDIEVQESTSLNIIERVDEMKEWPRGQAAVR